MKIILLANSINVADMLNQANLYTDYGYSYTSDGNDFATPNNSWAVKLASKLEKLFSFKSSKIDDDIFKYISKTANFLNEHLDTPEFLDGMKIQINVDTFVNSFVNAGSFLVAPFNMPLATKIFTSTCDTSYTNTFIKKIVIGSELFDKRNKPTLTRVLEDKIGLENTIAFLVLHEASHSFQFSNNEKLGVDYLPVFSNILTSCIKISNYSSEDFSCLNQRILKNKDIFPILDQNLIKNISSLNAEIYADTGAFLLARNERFINDSYEKEKSLEYIDALIEGRQKEQFKNKNNLSASDYVSSFCHFTSPGIEYLKENYETLPQRVLSQEEIHLHCQKCIQQGISRILISSMMANNENVGQLRTLFNLQNESGELNIPENKNLSSGDIFISSMTVLKKLAGENWMKEFNANIKIIKELKINDVERVIWHAGVNFTEFKRDLSNNNLDDFLKIDSSSLDSKHLAVEKMQQIRMASINSPQVNSSPTKPY